MNALSTLTAAWIAAKEAEAAANARRLGIEVQIAALLPGKGAEDTAKADVDGYRVKVQYKVTRSVDSEKLQALWPSLSTKAQEAFTWKASVKLAPLRALQEYAPAVYSALAEAIEVRPSKPSVSVESIEKVAA